MEMVLFLLPSTASVIIVVGTVIALWLNMRAPFVNAIGCDWLWGKSNWPWEKSAVLANAHVGGGYNG